MRVLVVSPPKTGNVWIENLLAATYQLRVEQPSAAIPSVEDFRDWVDSGLFAERTIFHVHYRPREPLFETAARSGIALVTTIRNPYDMFVSLYFYVQQFPEQYIRANDPALEMIGRPIDHRRTLRYLKGDFRHVVKNAHDWALCGQSIVVRYEDLHNDPFLEMKRVTDLLGPVDSAVIQSAVGSCSVAQLRQRSDNLKKHVRSATVGDWRNHLSEKHLRVFRSSLSEVIEGFGYSVE